MFELVTRCFFISFYLSCVLSFLVASSDLFITFPLPFSLAHAPPTLPTSLLVPLQTPEELDDSDFETEDFDVRSRTSVQTEDDQLIAGQSARVSCLSLPVGLDSYIPMPGILASCVVHIQRSALIHLGFVVRICVIHNKFTFKLCSQ